MQLFISHGEYDKIPTIIINGGREWHQSLVDVLKRMERKRK
jgi:hypothetical protein